MVASCDVPMCSILGQDNVLAALAFDDSGYVIANLDCNGKPITGNLPAIKGKYLLEKIEVISLRVCRVIDIENLSSSIIILADYGSDRFLTIVADRSAFAKPLKKKEKFILNIVDDSKKANARVVRVTAKATAHLNF